MPCTGPGGAGSFSWFVLVKTASTAAPTPLHCEKLRGVKCHWYIIFSSSGISSIENTYWELFTSIRNSIPPNISAPSAENHCRIQDLYLRILFTVFSSDKPSALRIGFSLNWISIRAISEAMSQYIGWEIFSRYYLQHNRVIIIIISSLPSHSAPREAAKVLTFHSLDFGILKKIKVSSLLSLLFWLFGS